MNKNFIISLGVLLIMSCCHIISYGAEIKMNEDYQLEKQKVTVNNSYLTSVLVDKETAPTQEVIVKNSFLVFIKVFACSNELHDTK